MLLYPEVLCSKSHHININFLNRFVPKDHFELLSEDPNTFEYLYAQVSYILLDIISRRSFLDDYPVSFRSKIISSLTKETPRPCYIRNFFLALHEKLLSITPREMNTSRSTQYEPCVVDDDAVVLVAVFLGFA